MVTFASLAAALLYLVPVAATVALRAKRGDEPGDVALSIPLGVALDLVTVLLLTLFVRLETAVLVSRPAWILATAVLWRVRRPAWPRALGKRAVVVALTGAAVGVAVSLLLSRPYSIWDRHWHTPLTSSLRGQTLPFVNVFDPREGLTYHFAGNVLAAVVQTLSFGVMHSSLALSVAHDLCFALTGAVVALLTRHLGARTPLPAAAAALAMLTAGPVGRLENGVHEASGYSFVNFLSLSFRPHESLAGLLFLGIVGSMIVRLVRRRGAPAARTAIVVLGSAALLAITDEASLGLAGVALGTTWLFRPQALHARRVPGLLLLAALPALLVGTNRLFSAALSPGAPARRLSIVPWRLPGYYQPVLSLHAPGAHTILAHDVLGFMLGLLGAIVLVRAVRSAKLGATVLAFGATAAFAVVALTRIDINGHPLESHRFATGAMLALPIFAVAWLAASRRAAPLARWSGRLLTTAALVLPTASTLVWVWKLAPIECERRHGFYVGDDFYRTDCRLATGAGVGLALEPRYLAKRVSYLYAGCQPLFVPGTPRDANWAMRINAPEFGAAAIAELDRALLPKGQSLRIECPARSRGEADPVCAWAQQHASCAQIGAEIVECTISPEYRPGLLSSLASSLRHPDR